MIATFISDLEATSLSFLSIVAGICYMIGIFIIGWMFVILLNNDKDVDISIVIKYLFFALLAFSSAKLITFISTIGEHTTKT